MSAVSVDEMEVCLSLKKLAERGTQRDSHSCGADGSASFSSAEGKGFSSCSESALKSGDGKKVECGTCGVGFSTRSNLNKHVRTVHATTTQLFGCSMCEATFTQRCSLVKHVRVLHENRKEHTCPHCDATFGQRGDLKVHIQGKHLKERPFECAHCEQKFSTRSNMLKHVRTVHEKRRTYTCTQCSLSFGQSADLKKHVLGVHEKIRAFKCAHCKAAFSQRSDLKKHMSTQHTLEYIRLVSKTPDASFADCIAQLSPQPSLTPTENSSASLSRCTLPHASCT